MLRGNPRAQAKFDVVEVKQVMIRMNTNDRYESVPHSGLINISDPDARYRWAKAFSVSEPVLMKAVQIVGTSIPELRNLFCPEDSTRR